MKGIIAVKDDDQRFVVEAVHMLLEDEFQDVPLASTNVRCWGPKRTSERET